LQSCSCCAIEILLLASQLIINEENTKYLRDKGIKINTLAKSYSIEVKCPTFAKKSESINLV
jgi:hypothetical protein